MLASFPLTKFVKRNLHSILEGKGGYASVDTVFHFNVWKWKQGFRLLLSYLTVMWSFKVSNYFFEFVENDKFEHVSWTLFSFWLLKGVQNVVKTHKEIKGSKSGSKTWWQMLLAKCFEKYYCFSNKSWIQNGEMKCNPSLSIHELFHWMWI